MIKKNLPVLLFILSSALSGKELRWTHFGLRPLGMGNAYVAIADDYNALFYNPAGLARLKEWDGELLSIGLETNSSTISFSKTILQKSKSNSSDISELLTLIKPEIGSHKYLALRLTPHLIFPNFGFGLGFETMFNFVPHSSIQIDVDSHIQAITPISYARNFFEDRLSIGATIKTVTFYGIDEKFDLNTLAIFDKENKDPNKKTVDELLLAGFGVGADLGLLFTPKEVPMEPTLGLSMTDVGDTKFMELKNKKNGLPPTRSSSLNSGIRFFPYKTDKTYISLAFDTHMMNQPIHYTHKYHLGGEFGLGEFLKIQMGLKEGYWTAGIQLDAGLINLRVVSYAVDHGPVVGLHDKLAERRYALQLKILI